MSFTSLSSTGLVRMQWSRTHSVGRLEIRLVTRARADLHLQYSSLRGTRGYTARSRAHRRWPPSPRLPRGRTPVLLHGRYPDWTLCSGLQQPESAWFYLRRGVSVSRCCRSYTIPCCLGILAPVRHLSPCSSGFGSPL